MSVKFSRREVITHLKNILGGAGLCQLLPTSLLAKDANINKNEHFFIFVELKGGVHHLITTDYPHPEKTKAVEGKHAGTVMRFKIDTNKKGFMQHEEINQHFKELLMTTVDTSNPGSSTGTGYASGRCYAANGYFIALPDGGEYYIHPNDSSKRLGYSGLPLADHVDKLAVLRGVCMLGNFHDTSNREIYSGSNKGLGGHVAGVLSKLLADKQNLSPKPLDNLVLNNAAYVDGAIQLSPLHLTIDMLQALLGNTSPDAGKTMQNAQKFAQALLQDLHLGGKDGWERQIFAAYHAAFANARAASDKFAQLNIGDAKFDLYTQLRMCTQLFQAGLTRVATICFGANEGAFGLFDSHTGVYHDIEVSSNRKALDNPKHATNLKQAMLDLSKFIEFLEKTPYGNKKMIDMVTIVVSSDFGRNANFGGGRVSRDDTIDKNLPLEEKINKFRTSIPSGDALGNGHYYLNNNYIFCGKNINSVWLGESDPITRYPYVADFARIQRGEFGTAVFSDPIDPTSKTPQASGLKIRGGFEGPQLEDQVFDRHKVSTVDVPRKQAMPQQRALMAKDVVRTIMAIAGLEADFSTSYAQDFYKDAQLLTPLVKR